MPVKGYKPEPTLHYFRLQIGTYMTECSSMQNNILPKRKLASCSRCRFFLFQLEAIKL